MKFWDILRISIHNIFNNKLRTLLVTIVLFILSTIVVIVASLGINVATVINETQTSGDYSYADLLIGYEQVWDTNTGLGMNSTFFTKEEIENYKNTIKDDYPFLQYMNLSIAPSYVDIYVKNSYSECTLIDFNQNILAGGYNYLQDGRLWTKEDKNKPYIWVNTICADASDVRVGDIIDVKIYKEARVGSSADKYTSCKMTVMGIVDYQANSWSKNSNVLFDYEYALDNGAKINKIYFNQSKISDGASIAQLNKIKSFIKANNTHDYMKNPLGLRVYSQAVESQKMAMIFTAVIVIVVLVISVIIILLSIGCVSNSIQITVEQNVKFFGMMKAIGMRNSVVKRIVRVQAVIIILISIILATAVTIGVLYAINPLLANLLTSMGVSMTLSMPFYVPIVVFAILVGMVMLFTLKSLNKISKMDVVSVISEVN